MTRPVAAGLDGSAESRAAADWAAREAVRRGLPLLLAHAWIVEPLDSSPTFRDRERAETLLEEVAAELRERHPDLRVSGELLPEVASAALPDLTERVELLALGSRGHSALVGFLLGSVGLHVLGHARGPTVLVRDRAHGGAEAGAPASAPEATDAGDATAGGEPSTGGPPEVVVGVRDLGDAADTVLRFAFDAAAAHGATIRAVRAWGAPGLFGYDVPETIQPHGENDVAVREELALTEALAPWRERFPGVRVVEQPAFGNSSEVLLAATGPRTGLLVIGRRLRRTPLGARMGPVAHAAVHHVRAPVAVVPYT